MTKVKVLGTIHAVTYACSPVSGTVGLCVGQPGVRYRHEWKSHNPQLGLTEHDQIVILCNIDFKDNMLVKGIGDADGPLDKHQQSCEVITTPPKRLSPLGFLESVEFVGSTELLRVDQGDAVLAVSKSHNRLFVIPSGEWSRYGGGPPVSIKDTLDELSSGVAPAMTNPEYSIQDPDLKALLDFNAYNALAGIVAVEDHLEKPEPGTETKASWCIEKHGKLIAGEHHMNEFSVHAKRANVPELANRMIAFKSNWYKALENPKTGEVSELRNQFRADFAEFLPKGCSGTAGICAHDHVKGQTHEHTSTEENSSPESGVEVVGNGIVVWGTSHCHFCQSLENTLQDMGIDHQFIDVGADKEADRIFKAKKVAGTPYTEVYKGGKVVNHALGDLDREEIEEMIGEEP